MIEQKHHFFYLTAETLKTIKSNFETNYTTHPPTLAGQATVYKQGENPIPTSTDDVT